MLLLVLFVVATGARVRAFNVTYLSVPKEVLPTDTEIVLECHYEGNFTLLNWFKGPNEFFRYKPGGAPSVRSFPIIGVGRIEMVNCGPTSCYLRLGELTEEASGLYRCDIERDVKPYKFATKSAYMRVYGQVNRRPVVEGLATEFGAGDQMKAYCRTEFFTEVRWYINGREQHELRGSHTFEYKSSRLIFSGMPPTVSVKCVQIINGRLTGSIEAKAHWRESFKTNKYETAQEQKNLASNAIKFNFILIIILSTFVI